MALLVQRTVLCCTQYNVLLYSYSAVILGKTLSKRDVVVLWKRLFCLGGVPHTERPWEKLNRQHAVIFWKTFDQQGEVR